VRPIGLRRMCRKSVARSAEMLPCRNERSFVRFSSSLRLSVVKNSLR
jgi:hypothetical protein